MINGHDYLLRKCGFLAQQLLLHDSNLGRDVSSCRQSRAGMTTRSPDEVFTRHQQFGSKAKCHCSLKMGIKDRSSAGGCSLLEKTTS